MDCEHHLSVVDMLQLLDDFLILGPPRSAVCKNHLTAALEMCNYLGIPIADGKTTQPTTKLVFFGIVLDTVHLESRLPDDKKEDLLCLLAEMVAREHCTLKELQHLLDKLNFASPVIVPGHTFTRHVCDATLHASKPYHHIRMSLGLALVEGAATHVEWLLVLP